MKMRLFWTRALCGLLLLTIIDLSGCLQTTVRPDSGSTVTVSTELPQDQCTVCTVASNGNDTKMSCHTSITLAAEKEVTLWFNCLQPFEQYYTATISRTIECTKETCSPATVEVQSSILPEFTRFFTLELKAPETIAVSLDIIGNSGLIESTQPCADGLQYSVATSKTNTKGHTQYCHGGSVTRLDLLNDAVVTLKANPNALEKPVLFQASAGPLKGRTMVVTVNSSTTLVVSRDPKEPECEVCTVEGSTPNCNPTEKTLTNADKLTLEFGCLKPQDMYSIKMNTKIECTKSSCTPAAGEVDPNLFKDFQRSVSWDIKIPEKTVLTLDFPGDGLEAATGLDTCKDGYQFSVRITNQDGNVKRNLYCKGGKASHLNMIGSTTVTVEVPKGVELDQKVFDAKAAPRGGRMISVTPDPNTIITISRVTNEPECSVCMDKEPKQICKPRQLRITNPRITSVEFTCSQPQELFSVEINREIDCTESSCSGDIVQAESSLFPDFNRTFTWDLKVVSTRAFQLDFQETGMRQIPNEETCPDGHTYSVTTYLRSGPATIGTFCKGGSVTTILARYKGRVSLQVPGDVKLDPVDFKLHVGPETDMVAIVKVNLPRGVSDTDFISANYPGDFPDKQMMEWNFTVPGMHNYSVHFSDHTAPECLDGNDVEVEYKKNTKVTKLTLTDPQPKHQQGSFNMMLKNCETNRTLQGLALKFRVSVMRSGHPVLCSVDLTKHQGVSVQLTNVGSDPYCEMSINSKVEEKINVAAGTKASLSFLDCPNEDVRLTASQNITCRNRASCATTSLNVPQLASCFPVPLHSFTWHLNIPQDHTVDLVSPTGSLRQSLPGQECNQSFSLHVAEEEDGFPVGDFCFDGIIHKLQVHTNVSVTATAQNFSSTMGPFLNVSFSREIPETFIYRVNPNMLSPVLLATPGWPRGMKHFTTASWIVDVPSQYQADVQFVNVSQPKCQDRHTAIKVKMLGQEEEIMSRREDEKPENLLVKQSFYLNMSNCIPEQGQFSALTKIALQKKINLLAIVLGIAGAVLLLLVVLAVVCIVTKKKKKDQMNKESSIYIGRGSFFRPGDRHFTKSRSQNESHVYDSIDETMVYGHLLGDSTYNNSMQDNYKGIQVDSYQTFTGPGDNKLPVIKEPEPEMDQFNTFLAPSETFIPSRPRTPIDRQDSLGFQDRRMVDNELYTFKSTGDINTIRLSGADMEPQPPVTEDYL